MPLRIVAIATAFVVFAACGEDEPGLPDQVEFGGDRPTRLFYPGDYDNAEPLPLVLVLHGYRASSYLNLAYTRTRDLPDLVNVMMVAPDGVIGDNGYSSWNASEACCGTHDEDDVAYLSGLVEEISSVWNVDSDRVFAFGHSNGGFMAYRLACDRADLFAGIVSLAGMGYDDCEPSESVSVLHMHGTEDDRVDINGTETYPGAKATLDAWTGYNACDDAWEEGGSLDLDGDVDGAETQVMHNAGCRDVGLDFWRIEGGGHIPAVGDDFPLMLWEWMDNNGR